MDTGESSSVTGRRMVFSGPWPMAILYLALVGYFYSFSEYGFNIWDEGGYANGTLRTLHGEKALVDFNPNGYLPGRYWYGAIFFKLFGVEISSLRFGVILLTPAMIFMVYAAARKLLPAGFAVLAALFMLSAPGMYYNRFYPFFCVLNLYCLLQALEKRRARQLMFLGGAILLSAFFKFEVALFSTAVSIAMVAVLVLHPSWRREFFSDRSADKRPGQQRSSTWIAAGFLGFTAIVLTVSFLSNNYFEKVFKLVVEAHRVWGNPFPTLLPFFQLLQEEGPHEMFERLLFYLPIAVYVLTGIVLLSRFLKPKAQPANEDLYLIAILSLGICAFGLVVWRAGFDNLLRTLPPFYILFCYLLYLGRGWILRSMASSGPGGLLSTRLRRVSVNVLTVFLPFLFYYEMNVHHGFYAGTVGAVKMETAPLKIPRLKVYTSPAEADWIRAVVDRIETYTQKGDPVLALPLNPIFYFLTDRVNPTPYDWILPGMLDEEEEKKVVELLAANKPKLIVYVDIAIDGKEERRLSHYAPRIFKFITDNYGFEEFIGIFQILLPK